MTYKDIMARRRTLNVRMGLLFPQPVLFLFGFVGLMELGTVPNPLLWLGLVVATILSSTTYGQVSDEFDETSALADPWKFDRLMEDLGRLTDDLPTVKVLAHQEMGNFRYPTRMLITMQGYDKPICYNWQNGRFVRYKWTIIPLSMEKIIARAKQQT